MRTMALRLAQAERWVKAQTGWRLALLAFAAGGLSVLSFAPFFFSAILFLTLPVLVWLIDAGDGSRGAAINAWWFAFGYFFFNLFWVGEAFLVEADKFAVLLPFAVTLLPAGLALFWAAAAAVAKKFWWSGISRVLTLAITLSVAEWLRGHVLSGFPWNVLGYALTWPDTLMQSASLAGVYALTIPAVLIFAAPLVCMCEGGQWRRALSFAVVPLLVIWGFGAWRLSNAQVATIQGVKLRIVQPSVPQREKWLPEFQRKIFADHLELSRTNPAGQMDDLAGITHVVWPEAAMPFLPLEHPEALEAIAGLTTDGRQLISGALRRDNAIGADGAALPRALQKGFNSLMVFKGSGELAAVYDKTHLVPFGEYLPLEPVLSALGLTKLAHGHGAFATGPEPRPLLNVVGLPPVGGLICYEVLFPGAIVQGSVRPGVLINVTNDGWFGNSTGPQQHFHQARVRAVEEGLALIRAANNGVSGVINPYGQVVHRLGLNARGTIDSALPAGLPATVYGEWGDLPLIFLLVITGLFAARTGRFTTP